jgi:hypothetical protein
MKECPNNNECGKRCMECVFCGAPYGFVNEDCEGCCGNDGCVPYARQEKYLEFEG